jgi:hypothetical protein
MNIAMPIQQRGVTLGGLMAVVFVLVVAGIFAIKIIPPYIENAEIKKVFQEAASDPEMKKATVHDIQVYFDKRASIDNIKAIKADEIDIAMDQDKMVLSASYFVKIPLVGNVSLYIDFNPTSAP